MTIRFTLVLLLSASLAAHAEPPQVRLPAAVASRLVDFDSGERARVDRLRADETALALPLRERAVARLASLDRTFVPIAPVRIDNVNGKTLAQVAFTPGAMYVVQGSGFGNTAGQVRVTGPFAGGLLPVAVELWTDSAIVLRVPAAFGG